MEDKTPIYILMIVGIVALVAVVYMFTGSRAPATDFSDGITANVVADDVAPVNGGAVGRTLFGIVLIGTCTYMYHKW